MNTSEKFAALVERLYKQTIAKQMRWDEDLVESNCVTTSIRDKSVEIAKTRDGGGGQIIRVTIRDALGNVLDQFDDDTISHLSPAGSGGEDYWPMMSELHSLATRQAKGADEALDDILDSLS